MGAGDASAKWKAPRASLDHGFGNDGWASVPLPVGKDIDLTESLSSVAAGPGHTYFVIASLEDKSATKISGGVIEKFNSRGELVRGFGRAGIKTVEAPRTPVDLHHLSDGSMILTSALLNRKQNLAYWELSRLRADGSADQRFGSNGTVRMRIPDPGNKWSPLVQPLDHGRFGVVDYDYSPKNPRTRLRVFRRDGKLDRTFADGGRRDFAFDIYSVVPASNGKILIGGTDSTLHVARLDAHGAFDSSWGIDGIASTGISNPKRWVPAFDPEFESVEFYPGAVQVREVHRRVVFAFQAYLDYDGGAYVNGWAQRFTARGDIDMNWGVHGRRALGGSYNSDESDEGDYSELDFAPLSDGRLFYGEYFNGSWSTENDYTLRVVGASGTAHAKGSKAIGLYGFWELAHTFAADSKYYFALGEKRGRKVVIRIRF
jgi:hypothetical protein